MFFKSIIQKRFNLIFIITFIGGSSLLGQQLPLNKFSKQVNAARLNSPQNANAGISIAKLKGVFITYNQSGELNVMWPYVNGQKIECDLYYARKPGLGDPVNYPNKITSYDQRPDENDKNGFIITDGFIGLDIGIYYCIVRAIDNPDLFSIEFLVFIQPPAPVRMLEPTGTVALNNSPLEFRWQPINGVPYYFIFLSQGKIEIIEDDTGEVDRVEGLNLIWQAFTDKTFIRYGESDISGSWPDANTPPLIPGEEYNWMVFSAFAPDMRYGAWGMYPIASSNFSVQRQTFSQIPEITYPVEGQQITEDEITFSWTPVTGATRYSIYIQEIFKNDDIGEGTIISWQYVTIDTKASFPARELLAFEDYKVRVIAEGPGAMSASVEHRFHYNPQSGLVELKTCNSDSSIPLTYTQIEIEKLSGIRSAFTYFTGKDANFKLDMPVGNYRVNGRANGYINATSEFTVTAGEDNDPYLIFQPGFYLFSGRIINAVTQTPVPFAQIQLNNGENLYTDGAGYFIVAPDSPINSFFAHALGYEGRTISPINYDIENHHAFLGDLPLNPANSTITGRLTDKNGLAVSGGTLYIKNDHVQYTRKINQSGQFEHAVASGDWEISAKIPGYYTTPIETNIKLASGESRSLFLTLNNASILNGKVVKDGLLYGSGSVKATEQTLGTVLETKTSNFGTFRFDLQAGTWDVAVNAGENGYKREIIEIGDNQVKTVSFSLQQVTTIAGVVTNAETNAPLADVQIFNISTNEVLAVTGADGSYQFAAIPNETYVLSAILNGVETATATVVATDGGVKMQSFALRPQASSIRGRVLHNSKPVAGARVLVTELNQSVLTDTNGQFSINVAIGSYTLLITAGCLDPQQKLVNVLSNAGTDVEVVLTGSASIVSGRIFDQHHQPIADANLLAAGNSSYSSRSDSHGNYALCLDAGSYYLLVSHIGYLTQDTTFAIIENDTIANVNFYLEDNFATLTGLLTTTQGQPVPNIQLIFSNAWQQEVTLSDQNGSFTFDNLYPGQGVLIIRSTDYYSAPKPVNLTGKEVTNLSITLNRNDAFISGVVIDQKSGSGLADVQLIAQVVGGSQLFTTQSNSDGSFLFSNMPSLVDLRFKITAVKGGYALVQAAEAVEPNTASLVIGMLAKNAVISGHVIDKDAASPVAGVTVILNSLGRGPDVSVLSQPDGSFAFSELVESFEYSLSIQHPHFEQLSYPTSAPASDIKLNVQRIYAWVTGNAIFLDSQMPFRNANFIFTNLDGQGKGDTIQTDVNGYFLASLWTGQYQVRVEAPLYFGAPANATFNLPLNTTTDVGTFTLEKQQLDQLFIDGPSEFSNHLGGQQYKLNAYDTLNRAITSIASVEWLVDIGKDTAQFTQNGYLLVNSSFLGELNLSITDSVTKKTAQKRIEVVADMDSTTNALFFGRQKQTLSILPGTIDASTTIRFSSQNLSPVQNVEKNFRAINPLVKIIPDNIEFNKPALLSLPVPDDPVWGKLGILRWDNLMSTWQLEEDLQFIRINKDDDIVSREIVAGGEYGLVEISEPLDVFDLKLRPNPFSPSQLNEFDEPGIAVSFVLTSNRVALPLVTAKIYSIQGDLVSILANQKPTGKGAQYFSWDGLTLDGRIARNGRYILHFIVEDGSKKQEILKSIVLIQ
ncbi:carboxypeptidase regulatory-like domain-containing protein [candidate division KSB1 bacterium]|nr:carboxypeptidase regulatory-like domain-containing protein [candidate division KSB1 bacterium]